MTPIPIEHKHGGHGAAFEIDAQHYYVPTCCALAEVEIIDEDTRQCVTNCPNHGRTRRAYDAALTNETRAQLDWQVFGSSDDFNPASDPRGERQQRQRQSGYTTHGWHEARS